MLTKGPLQSVLALVVAITVFFPAHSNGCPVFCTGGDDIWWIFDMYTDKYNSAEARQIPAAAPCAPVLPLSQSILQVGVIIRMEFYCVG